MKKLFKLFPLALAALTFASCSDDLTIANGEKELTYSPDQLMVQIEGDGSSDITRGGYVTNIYNYNLYSALAFDLGETLKLYHDATSWKPEIWTADAYGQYKNATGLAVFKNAAATITADENAYGIYPSTASVFGNEDRTSIQYDLSDLAFVNYSVDATKTYAGTTGEGAITKYYQAEFPLWGVKAAGAQVMTMKHLAGILRLDIASIGDLPVATVAPTPAQYKYVIVYSATKKLTGKINTAADLLNPTLLEELDPTTFMNTTPALEVEPTENTAPLANIPLTEAVAETYDNIIVMRIDASTTDDHVMAYVPILPEMAGGDVEIYVTPVLTTDPATIDLTVPANIEFNYTLTADIIKECNDAYQPATSPYAGLNTVQRGVTYKINDDTTNKNETAKTPFQLAEGIIAADKAAYRDFDVYFTQPIEVKNNDDSPQNFWVNIAGGDDRYGLSEGWELKHNVTVHLTLKESDDAGTVPSVLYIKTKGGKKLTLDITNDAKKVDSIVVVKDGLKNELVLKEATGAAKLPNIHINEGNATADKNYLTVKSGTDKIIANSNFTLTTGVNAGDNVDNLTIGKGTSKVTINGGRISTVLLADGTTATSAKIAGDVTIYSEGNVSINQISYANMPKDGTTNADLYNVKYESLYVPALAAPTYAVTKVLDGATTINDCILTAAQLATMTTAAKNYTVFGQYDLNGSNYNWTSLAGANQNISGAQYFRSESAANRAITGFTTIKNLKGVNGLLASWTPANNNDAISNIIFDGGCAVKSAAGNSKTGLLVGEVINTTAAGIIKNIKVQGTNTIEGQGNGQGIGGVIGKITDATNALTLGNISVASAETTVKGFKYVGGIVGEVAGKVLFAAAPYDVETNAAAALKGVNSDVVATTDKADKFNKSEANLVTYKIGTTSPASENLPTQGQFFGGASGIAADGNVTIIGALNEVASPYRTSAEWGYYLSDANHENWVWPATLYYNEIGLCGYEVTGSYALGLNVGVDAAVKQIWMYTTTGGATPKYNTKTVLAPFVGTEAQYNTAVAATATYGIGKTKFFSFVKKPF